MAGGKPHGSNPRFRHEADGRAQILDRAEKIDERRARRARAAARPTCEHPEFNAEVDVVRLDDVGAFTAAVRIHCLACDEPFVFIGSLPSGLSSMEPRVNIDGSELRAPIQPASWGRTGLIGYVGFTAVRVVAGDG
jgi:hypothetical protein